jgi:hypothetical protein
MPQPFMSGLSISKAPLQASTSSSAYADYDQGSITGTSGGNLGFSGTILPLCGGHHDRIWYRTLHYHNRSFPAV